jgi:hypothetical protein
MMKVTNNIRKLHGVKAGEHDLLAPLKAQYECGREMLEGTLYLQELSLNTAFVFSEVLTAISKSGVMGQREGLADAIEGLELLAADLRELGPETEEQF